jgi:hypothetical protein
MSKSTACGHIFTICDHQIDTLGFPKERDKVSDSLSAWSPNDITNE